MLANAKSANVKYDLFPPPPDFDYSESTIQSYINV